MDDLQFRQLLIDEGTWRTLLVPFHYHGMRDRFPELNDGEFEEQVALPVIAGITAELARLATLRRKPSGDHRQA